MLLATLGEGGGHPISILAWHGWLVLLIVARACGPREAVGSWRHPGLVAGGLFVVLLALVPHVYPHLLDVLYRPNPERNRGYTEFGGIQGKAHGGFIPTAETALYGVALNFLDVLVYLPLLAQRALLPVFARLDVEGGSSAMARRSMDLFTAVLIPAVVGLVLLAEQAVALYPSRQFDAAAPVVQILTLGILFSGPSMVLT